ncbi:MAG: hypothetical protein CME62_09045 [Halobacteriovoraceae bacterium]|nr:hypothetical protein [Halobacteriovoraceae bacterium]|tara:strand:- start:9919 stop:10344 length:426 start_codon:yes stop_codon:yes gene_type:complete
MKKKKVQVVIFYHDANNKKQFLLLKMNERRMYLWQNVTGSVDEGEKYSKAALREAKEETGIKKKNIKNLIKSSMKFTFTDQYKKDITEKIFFLEAYEKWDVKIDPKEHCDFKWVDENDINRDSVHFDSNYKALVGALEFEN